MKWERTFPEYPGHFDDRPVVPGAALLAWVTACVPGLDHLERVRFTAPVSPGEVVQLEVVIEGADVTFTIAGEGVVRLRGKGRRSA